MVRTTSQVSSGPFEHQRHDRPTAHERDEVGVEALADVLFVVPCQRLQIEHAQIEGDDLEILGFEAPQHFADEATFDGIGLEQDKGAIRHGR